MSNIFVSIYRFLQKHLLVLWLTLCALVLFCVFGALHLNTEEDISSFLPQNADNERINYAYQHIGAANQIVLGVTCTDSLRQFDSDFIIEAVDYLADRIGQIDTFHVKSVQYAIDQQQRQQIVNFIIANLPYYLVEEDYVRVDSLITSESIPLRIAAIKKLLTSPAGAFVGDMLIADPLGIATPLLQGLQGFKLGSNYKLIDDYIFNSAGNEATVVVTSKHQSSETRQNAILLANIQQAIDSTIAEFEGQVDVSIFSASAIAITNAGQIKRDSWVTISIALVFIVLLLAIAYRNVKSIALIVASLAFGGLFAVGVISCFSTSISIIAIGVGSVIVGIAANYPLHFLSHVRHGYTCEQSIRDISAPLLTGNITTIGAFLSLLFISSGAMHDLGVFASLLLVGTIVFVLIFMPHLYAHNSVQQIDDKNLVFGRLAALQPETNRWFVLIICLLTLVFWFFSHRTGFDANMHNMNYMTANQREQLNRYMQMMFDKKQTVYCVAEGGSIDEALYHYEQAKPGICSAVYGCDSSIKVSGIGAYLPSLAEQRRRLNLWTSYWQEHATAVVDEVKAESAKQGFTPSAFDGFTSLLVQNFEPHGIEHFAPFIEAFGSSYIINNEGRAMVLSVLLVDKEKVGNVEAALNGIDVHIFGFDSSSITAKLVDALSADFDKVLYICGFIVLAFLTLSFGRIEISLLAFVPLAVGWLWILGIMGITSLQFNIVNIILATFIFGQGDDYTIFVTEGLMYEYTYRRKMLKSYKNTVLLSAFIMFVGIGSLVFAQHPAMKSLGEVTIVGMFCVVLMAYVFPPLIFKWLTTKKGAPRLMPITLWNLLKTILAFVVFLFGSIVLTLIGFVLLTIGGKTERHKYMYHKCLCGILRLMAKLMFEVKFKVDNPNNENFTKPCVITCNHQSHLDLLYTLMLSPRIVCLTNKWVWNCPFYGWIIRYADFLPVEDGIENNVDKLAQLMKKGYSILVFPEGTRSEDCSILRFHQGAFYLAKQLNVDVTPIVIHGVGHFFPKKEFLLRKGQVTIKVLDRITSGSFADEPRKIAQQVRGIYNESYRLMSEEIENTDYYYDLVLSNYIYKGRAIEQRARRLLKEHDGFRIEIGKLPETGSIRIENCGQGEYPLMAALVKKNLQIVATDPNSELVDIARNCASVPQNLRYELG